MECLLFFLMMLVVLVVMTGYAARKQSRAQRRNRVFQHVADRFNGVCLPGGWFGQPTVRINYGATQAIISVARPRRSHGGSCTQVQIYWPDPILRLSVSSRFPSQPARENRRGEPIETGNSQFDENFQVRGSQPNAARKILSAGVQWQIEQLRRLAGNAELQVKFSRGRLLVRKTANLSKYSDLEQFTQWSLELYDQAMLTQTVGIEFVDDGAGAQPVERPRCQICGEDIGIDLVCCRRCKTPHHLECWQYYGACSVYGCQETRFVAPPASARGSNGSAGAQG